MGRRVLTSLSLALGLLFFGLAPVHATPTLKFEAGGMSLEVDDQSGDDLNGTVGKVSYSGTFAGWELNVTFGVSNGPGDIPYPFMDVTFNVEGSGPIIISFTDSNFEDTGSLAANIGGTLFSGATLTYNVYADSSNDPFGHEFLITTVGAFGPGGAYSGSATGALPDFEDPFSITQELVLTHSSFGGSVSSGDAELRSPVPEPASLLLLGSGLLGFALRRRQGRG